MTPTPPGTRHEDVVARLLRKRPGLAAAYVGAAFEAATEPGGRVALLRALRQVSKSRGMGKVAERAGIKVQSLSRALSDKGNPNLTTLVSITDSLGMRLVLVNPTEVKQPVRKKPADFKVYRNVPIKPVGKRGRADHPEPVR